MDRGIETGTRVFERYLRRPTPRRLEAVVQRFYPDVWAVASSLTGNEADAADVTQNVFLGLLRDPPKPGSVRSPRGYLAYCALSMAERLFRSARRRAEREREAAARVGAHEAPDPEEVHRLHEAVRALPERQRAAVELHYFAGLTVKDTAELIDVSERTAAEDLRRARQRLRARLGARLLGIVPGAAVPSVRAQVPPDLLDHLITGVRVARAISSASVAPAFAGVIAVKKAMAIASVVSLALVLGTSTVVLWSPQDAVRLGEHRATSDRPDDHHAAEPAHGGPVASSGGPENGPPADSRPTAGVRQLRGLVVVVGEDDRPLPDVRIACTGGPAIVCRSTAPGEYEIEATDRTPSGLDLPGRIVVEADGYIPEEIDASKVLLANEARKVVLLRSHTLAIHAGLGRQGMRSRPVSRDGQLVEAVRWTEFDKPLAGVEVRCFINMPKKQVPFHHPDVTLWTDAAGTAALAGLRSTDRVQVYAISESEGLRSGLAEVEAPFDEEVLLLEPVTSLRGRILDQNRVPVAGADIWIDTELRNIDQLETVVVREILRAQDPAYLPIPPLLRARSGDDGRFSLSWKASTRSPAIRVRREGYVPIARQIAAGESDRGELIIELERSRVIHGSIRSVDGEPLVEGASLWLLSAADDFHPDRHGRDRSGAASPTCNPATGEFKILWYSLEEAQRLAVAHGGAYRSIVVDLDDEQRSGRRPVAVVLEPDPRRSPPVLVLARCLDALSGEVVRGATIELFESSAGRGIEGLLKSGLVHFRTEPGSYELRARAPGYLARSAASRFQRGTGDRRPAQLDPACEEAFEVAVELERDPLSQELEKLHHAVWLEPFDAATGEPLEAQMLVELRALRLPHRTELFRRTFLTKERDGRTTIRHEIHPGDWELAVSVPEYRETTVVVTVPEDTPRHLPIRARAPLELLWKNEAEARAAVPHLVKRLATDDNRWGEASRLLARMGAAALPLVAELLDHDDSRVQLRALSTVGRMASDSTLRERLRALLARALQDEDMEVRNEAAAQIERVHAATEGKGG